MRKQERNNLEALISEVSFNLVNEGIVDKNIIEKLLGVLANNGVYAMWVYAADKLGSDFKIENDEIICPKAYRFMQCVKPVLDKVKSFEFEKKPEGKDVKELKKNFIKRVSDYFQNIVDEEKEITKLLFLKQLLEKTLIYARYHAKAMGD